nr:AMP-binding protein [uncultured Dorea sp.]
MESTGIKLTGKASIDKPWLKFYPEELRNVETPVITVEKFLRAKNPDENKTAFEYYGNKITWKELWEEVDKAAKSLKVLGFGEGNRIPLFLQTVPAHYILLLAAERIGAAIICRDDIPEELCFAIRKSKSETAFVMDYTSKADEELFRETTPMTRMIKISPYDYADRDAVPDYVEKEIASRYVDETETTEGDLTWDEFLALGKGYTEDYMAPEDANRPVFGAYTSGSTGISKLVIHSSSNIVAIAFQMSIFIPPSDVQERWWLPILPPALIAVTVSMTIFPLSAGLIMVLDPFCPLEDIDIAFMEQKPNFWALVPMLCEILMKSDRIPEDYDMSHLRTLGTGAEAMNERKTQEVEAFFHKHNVQATLSAGYGQSEGCSNFTLPNPMFPLVDGCVGMPMPATTMAVFSDDLEEMNYGEIGELCMTGPAMMLHYAGWRGTELTEKTLINHPDGKCWLHTGDKAYINEHGIVYILGRGTTERFGGGELYMMRMETKAVRVAGVEDGFFCFVPDDEHEGYVLPYFFVIPDGTKSLDEIKAGLKEALEDYEYPVEIRVIKERPFFHFKTNRKELTAAILEEKKANKKDTSVA